MNWFRKSKTIYRKPTIDEMIDEILSDPLVQLEMNLRKLGFNRIYQGDYYYNKLTYFINKLQWRNKYKFWNVKSNIFGVLNTNKPIILRYEYFFVSLYKFKYTGLTFTDGLNVYAVSGKLGLIDLKNIIGMKSDEIAKVLGDLDDIDNLRQFMRNNKIDKLNI